MTPFRSVLIQIQIVAVPFLAAMIILYIMAATMEPPLAGHGDKATDDNLLDENKYDYPTLLAGIIRNTFPDVLDNKDVIFICNGLIIGLDIILTSENCFRTIDGSVIGDNYRVTSGSRYWSRMRNIHNIVEFNGFGDGNLTGFMILRVHPPIMKGWITKENYVRLVKPPNEPELDYLGWTFPIAEAMDAFKTEKGSIDKCIFFHGAVVLTSKGNIVGFQRRNCNDSEKTKVLSGPFFERIADKKLGFPDKNITNSTRYCFLDLNKTEEIHDEHIIHESGSENIEAQDQEGR
ncbi:unnamed protein product [Phaedon cochleariae]|uniref:Peptidase S1 domain-containing protein n=1 Tax=Phaedon cochleariae TaxID=80249 RepID=A0A9P0GPE3_PHACE|nr:unnamed protein product [Phaedon cochleariae]